MREDRNQFQIIRKDARNCFVESLNDSFSIGRIHLAFAAYDQSKPAGQRQTNNVHIYIAVDEFLELCRKLDCGELRYMLQSKKKNGDNTPLQTVKKGRRPQKQHKFGGKNYKVPLSSPYLSKILLALTCQRFCFLRRAPLTVSIYAYRGALLAPAAFQTASERVKNIVF